MNPSNKQENLLQKNNGILAQELRHGQKMKKLMSLFSFLPFPVQAMDWLFSTFLDAFPKTVLRSYPMHFHDFRPHVQEKFCPKKFCWRAGCSRRASQSPTRQHCLATYPWKNQSRMWGSINLVEKARQARFYRPFGPSGRDMYAKAVEYDESIICSNSMTEFIDS